MSETQAIQKHAIKKRTKFRDNVTAMSIVGVTALILLASVLAAGGAIWNDYRDEIMNSQKNQLLITSQTIAGNMELSLREYVENLNYLFQQYQRGEDISFFGRYIDGKDNPEINFYIEDSQGEITASLYDFSLLESLPVTQVSEDVTIWQAKMAQPSAAPQDRHILIFKHTIAGGGHLCLVIDEDTYYRQLTSGVQIGTNGYIMMKNSDGIILMHPEENQIGIHVIEGRKALYPDLDFTSLKAMVDEQCKGGDGLSEYYSYWWPSSPLIMVKKISAYAAADIGGGFWVVSSVIDYDDFCAPIEAGFRRVSSLFAISLAAAAVLFIFVSSLLLGRRRAMMKIRSLRELNERLETIHRGEELMAHQQRLQVIGTMTGGIAHEFNNLLTPIMGYADLLLMELDEHSDAYENALEICDASQKAKEVVRQISLMSRRNVETVFTKVDCGQMLDRAFKMVQPICPANIRTELKSSLGGVNILGNRSQLHQVILNICINAIHAIGDGDGLITISGGVIAREELAKTLTGRGIRVSENWGSYASIQIRDNGCGMVPETLRQIFKPFFTTKKAGEGTGLGLALAEQIVTSHRGILCAESTPGEGSTFHIFLPVLAAPELLSEMAPGEAQKLRIAAGDDNPKVLGLLEKNFGRLDVQIRTGSTRAELLAILRDGETDALVIDENIEDRERSGVDFCMSLQGQFPSLLKLVMTDYITDGLAEAMQNHIIDGCLLKPVSDASILEEIRRLRTAHL